MTDDEKVAPAQFSQRSQKFHLTELLIGLFIGVLIGGGSVYVWQQRVWQPTVASLKSEYAQLNESYLSYKPPSLPPPASESGIPTYGNGEQVRTSKEKFSENSLGFSYPSLSGTTLDVTVYSYKGKTITNLRSDEHVPENGAGIDVWRYDSAAGAKDIPDDFVTFYGYENYALFASPVSVTMEDSDDNYTTADGTVWKYQYEYAPKSIGVVSLTTYVQPQKNTTGKPLFIRVWYATGLGHQKTDPEISAAKIKIAKFVDAVEL